MHISRRHVLLHYVLISTIFALEWYPPPPPFIFNPEDPFSGFQKVETEEESQLEETILLHIWKKAWKMEKESVHCWAISMICQDKIVTAWFVLWGTQSMWFSFIWGGETPFKKKALQFRNAWLPLHEVAPDYINFWLEYYEITFFIFRKMNRAFAYPLKI